MGIVPLPQMDGIKLPQCFIKPEKLEEIKILMGDNVVEVLSKGDQRADW